MDTNELDTAREEEERQEQESARARANALTPQWRAHGMHLLEQFKHEQVGLPTVQVPVKYMSTARLAAQLATGVYWTSRPTLLPEHLRWTCCRTRVDMFYALGLHRHYPLCLIVKRLAPHVRNV